jgi:branched-chain amino acid transport system ATP-binding protein
VITGYQPPDAGRVTLDGRDITGVRPDRIARLGVARTFQKLKPFPDLTVTENVIVGALARTADMKVARDQALEALAFVDLLDKRNSFARELSTGQRGITIVTIEHNMQVMMRLADRILALHAGRRIAFGKPEEVRKDPAVVDAYLGTAANAA